MTKEDAVVAGDAFNIDDRMNHNHQINNNTNDNNNTSISNSSNNVNDEDTSKHNGVVQQNQNITVDKDKQKNAGLFLSSPSTTTSSIVQQSLRQRIKTLEERCKRLEAQSILVSVQQLDILTKCISNLVWFLILVFYWKCILVFIFPHIPYIVSWLLGEQQQQQQQQYVLNMIMERLQQQQQQQQLDEEEQTTINNIIFSFLRNIVYRFIMESINLLTTLTLNVPLSDTNNITTTTTTTTTKTPEHILVSFLQSISTHFRKNGGGGFDQNVNPPNSTYYDSSMISTSTTTDPIVGSWTIVPTVMATMVIIGTIKIGLLLAPFIHHRIYHGLLYRRIEVFTIFFVVFLRTRYCRWRESMFIVTATPTNIVNEIDNNTTNTSTTSNNNDVDDIDNDDDGEKMQTTATPKGYGEDITEDSIWDANYEVSARYLYVSIIRLKGLWTKTAQYLSSRADFMPPSYVRELKRLQDEAPETSWDDIVSTIPSYILDAVTDVCTKPLASASIGQVHTATLKRTGEKIVLKIQHPFASTLLYDDFRSLSIICRLLSIFEPEYEFIEILMKEWTKEAIKELNFLVEGQNLIDAQLAINTMFGTNHVLWTTTDSSGTSGSNNNINTSTGNGILNATKEPVSVPFHVEVPRPFMDLCTKKILIMTYCEGTRIDDFDTIDHIWHIPRTAVVSAVAQSFAHMMYCTNVFNGDPHVGNLKIRKGISGTSINSTKTMVGTTNGIDTNTNNDDLTTNGFTIVLLDWGLTKRLNEQQRFAFCQMAYAASTFDFGLLLDAFDTIGLRMKRENVTEDMEGIRFLLRTMAPQQTSRKRIKAKMKTDIKRMKERPKKEKIPMEAKAYPGEFFFFVRVNELLQGLGSKFHIHLNYLDVIKPYTERGIYQFPLYNGEYDNNCKHRSKTGDSSIVPGSEPELENKIMSVISYLKSQNNIAGVQVAVLDSNGNHLVNVFDGHFGGLKKNIPMKPDALILAYSCTKAITATLAHVMVKEGYLTYDEPVCARVWQAFCPSEIPPINLYSAFELSDNELDQRWRWKRQITLRHILTHSAGLWTALPKTMTVKSLASCEQCASAFEYNKEKPEETLLPTSSPGGEVQYHAMSFGWLVAGTLMGAYALQHQKQNVTFHEVYTSVLVPKLSSETLQSGFRPFGPSPAEDVSDFPMAFTATDDVSVSVLAQIRKEAEAMGEGGSEKNSATIDPAMQSFLDSYRGKEFLLDQRIWNCTESMKANVPAAGGRFTATGLARFYCDLGRGQILDDVTLQMVTDVVDLQSSTASILQGETNMSSSSSSSSSSDGDDLIKMGFGYQLITTDKDKKSKEHRPSAFGHAGVGGSIGFHHTDSGISVAVMLNKADANKDTAKMIVVTIAEHFHW